MNIDQSEMCYISWDLSVKSTFSLKSHNMTHLLYIDPLI